MSFAWQDIKYGWKALVGIVLTGTTIYVAANTRHRLMQKDLVPIYLGVWERCEATRTGVNTWNVEPSTFKQQWMDGTNLVWVTNAIGWRSHQSMLAECQGKLEAVVPYYYDTNFDAYTFAGLKATLGITGTWGTARSSTNMMVEMHKMIYMLKNPAIAFTYGQGLRKHSTPSDGFANIAAARAAALANYAGNSIETNIFGSFIQQTSQENYRDYDGLNFCFLVKYVVQWGSYLSSNIEHSVKYYIIPDLAINVGSDYNDYYDQGLGISQSGWNLVYQSGWTSSSSNISDWIGGDITVAPSVGIVTPSTNYTSYWRGFLMSERKCTAEWDFQYCTNKFW